MKKKLALLLALTMILSLIPMNVFGATELGRGNVVSGLPANTRTTLSLDLANLSPYYWTGEQYGSDRVFTGYPVVVELKDGAHLGAALGLNSPFENYDGIDRNTASSAAYSGTDIDGMLKNLVALNEELGAWGGPGGPAISASIDTTNPYVNSQDLLVHLSAVSSQGLSALNDNVFHDVLSPEDGEFDTIMETGWAKSISNGNESVDALVGAPSRSGVTTSSGSTYSVQDVRDFYVNRQFSPAVEQWIFTWNISIISDTKFIIYVTALKQDKDGIFVPDRIPVGSIPSGRVVLPIHLPIYIDGDKWEAKMSVTDGITGAPIMPDASIVANYLKPDMSAAVGAKAVFERTGFIDQVQINEKVGGYINSTLADGLEKSAVDGAWVREDRVAIELKMDSDYARLVNNATQQIQFVDVNGTYQVDAPGTAFSAGSDKTKLGLDIGNRAIGQDLRTTTPYDVRLQLSRNGAVGSPLEVESGRYKLEYTRWMPDTLKVNNLMVVFDDRQPYNTDINLMYRLVKYGRATDGSLHATNDPGWNSAGAAVARGVRNLDVTIDAEAAAEILSGKRAEQTTSKVIIKEQAVGTWNNGSTILSLAGDAAEHADIVAAHVAVYDLKADGSRGDQILGTTDDDSVDNAMANWTRRDGQGQYRTIQRHQDYTNNAGITVNTKEVRIDPLLTYYTNVNQRREIEVQLQVSVEAGYVGKGYDPALMLALEGTNDYSVDEILVANISDPITVTIEDQPESVAVEGAYDAWQSPVGNVIITENKAGALAHNTELWMYVTGGRQIDLNLEANPVAEINTEVSGFQLYNGQTLHHSYGNFFLNGMRYNVQRPSGLGNTTEAAEIIISDVEITGQLYPSAEYQIVVSGNAVADNDYTVWTNESALVAPLANPSSQFVTDRTRAQSGIFDEAPYAIEAIKWDDTTGPTSEPAPVEEPPVVVAPEPTPAPAPVVPAPTPAPIVIPTPEPVRLPQTYNQYSQAYDEQGRQYNSMVMAAATNGVGFSGISPRAFADYIGGTTSWDAATSQATIVGKAADGSDVTVVLGLGNTSATINGVAYDIAEYNDHPGYPAGSIMPFQPGNNRIYLPIRFLCNAFKVEFTWDELTKSVTLY
jgi:hypothetical protein